MLITLNTQRENKHTHTHTNHLAATIYTDLRSAFQFLCGPLLFPSTPFTSTTVSPSPSASLCIRWFLIPVSNRHTFVASICAATLRLSCDKLVKARVQGIHKQLVIELCAKIRCQIDWCEFGFAPFISSSFHPFSWVLVGLVPKEGFTDPFLVGYDSYSPLSGGSRVESHAGYCGISVGLVLGLGRVFSFG